MRKSILIIIYKKTLTYLVIASILAFLVPYAFVKATNEKRISPATPLTGKIIVIDPGHGGVDSGTHYGQKILEKDINLKIGLILKTAIQAQGATVFMTRESDISLDDQKKNGSRHREDLNARVRLTNTSNADIFISIHANYIRNSSSTLGPMVFYYGSSEKSKQLAESIQQSLNTLSGYKKVGTKASHSAHKGNYVILRETMPPGVLVETGFLSNTIDRTLLQKESHQQEIAKLITEGLIRYFKHPEDIH